MLFLVINFSQFISLFFFATFVLVFGWIIYSVFVAEEGFILAVDWNFFNAFFVPGGRILDMSE